MGIGLGRENTAKSLFEAPTEANETGPTILCYMVKPTELPQVNN